jgi:hypothetical protein
MGGIGRNGFVPWDMCPPPPGVPLVVYCAVKERVYSKSFTREEIEAWGKEDQSEPVKWSQVGWRLTGIAKEMLGRWEE